MKNENRFSFWILLGILELGSGVLMACLSFANKEIWMGVNFLCNAIIGLAICQLGFNKMDIQDQNAELTKANKEIKTLEEKVSTLEKKINQGNQETLQEKPIPNVEEDSGWELPRKNIFMKR